MSIDLPETDPYHVYCTLQGAGIVREGRPIRGNFHCYRLNREHAPELRRLMGHGDEPRNDEELLAFINRHEKPWSQRMDREGYPLDRQGRRLRTATDPAHPRPA